MADPDPVYAIPGPWSQTRTTKVTLNALDFVITTTTESSHVPPPDKESNPVGSQLMDFIQQAANMIMQKLDEIRTAQTGD